MRAKSTEIDALDECTNSSYRIWPYNIKPNEGEVWENKVDPALIIW
jgi:hypothetical protein